MIALAESVTTCRHVAICRYFGEKIDDGKPDLLKAYCNNMCDVSVAVSLGSSSHVKFDVASRSGWSLNLSPAAFYLSGTVGRLVFLTDMQRPCQSPPTQTNPHLRRRSSLSAATARTTSLCPLWVQFERDDERHDGSGILQIDAFRGDCIRL